MWFPVVLTNTFHGLLFIKSKTLGISEIALMS